MRTKESAHDYRYFPEPDLPPFHATEDFLQDVESRLVELPAIRRTRFQDQYGLSRAQADFMCDERSTADYFEAVVAAGARADAVATWMAGDVRKQLNRVGVELTTGPLTPDRFAQLLRMLDDGVIHGKIAKQVLAHVFEQDKEPAVIIKEHGWEQITDRGELGAIVDTVLLAQPRAVSQIQSGDPKPMGFLIGQVMKHTNGRADPPTVQELLSERFAVRTILVFSFGGAIAGHRQEDGLVTPGDLMSLSKLFGADPELPDDVRFEEVQLGRFLSEEITPADWAALVARISRALDDGGIGGIVIGHGTDTLAYTASLLYWAFADSEVPIVLTAGAVPAEDGTRNDAIENLRRSVRVAAGEEPGVHVIYGEDDFFAVNLKFERAGYTAVPRADRDRLEAVVGGDADDFYRGAFRNWNSAGLARIGKGVAPTARSLPGEDLRRAMETAIARSHVAKIYPGIRGETLTALMDAGVRYFILEIYDTGTAGLRESPFSLRHAFVAGKERGVRFFCTSQQEGVVDFSGYVTAHELWREGAIPMGALTTESAWTRLIAAQIEAGAERWTEHGGDIVECMDADVKGEYDARIEALMEEETT
jgi:aspartyl-tRNA(Asn)/glutamyl-tRNA(Gln) amidotransferase subunit B